MVMSIIATLFALPLIIFAGAGIGDAKRRIRWSDEDDEDEDRTGTLILWSIQLLIGLAQAVIAITTAAFACRTVCCGKRSTAGAVLFNSGNNTEQFTAIPLSTVALPTASTNQQILGNFI